MCPRNTCNLKQLHPRAICDLILQYLLHLLQEETLVQLRCNRYIPVASVATDICDLILLYLLHLLQEETLVQLRKSKKKKRTTTRKRKRTRCVCACMCVCVCVCV